ncbi:MAG: hypothetical protein JO121_32090, partial [Deltaproteobacteria bacterium]|nr:hypothetical protein [Deltaproteobacteria bacterium]
AEQQAGTQKRKHTWLEIFAVFFAALAFLAAGYQGWVIRDNEKRQLRAYMFIDRVDFIIRAPQIHAVIHLKNSGQTPAYDLSAWVQMSTQASNESFVMMPKTSETFPMSRAIIGPGTTVRPAGRVDIPANNPAVIPAVEHGEAKAYAWGEVQYRDAFDQPWCLEFRLENLRAEDGSWGMQTTPEGNKESNAPCPNWPKRK